jgi:hypothetical protein
VQGEIIILGYIGQPFIGAGAGIEAPMGDHFSLNFDVNWGSQEDGTAWNSDLQSIIILARNN